MRSVRTIWMRSLSSVRTEDVLRLIVHCGDCGRVVTGFVVVGGGEVAGV